MSLQAQHLRTGLVLHIKTYRGEAENFLGQVIAIRDLARHPLSAETGRDKQMTRSRYLVTLKATGVVPEAESVIKSFYHAFVDEAEVVAAAPCSTETHPTGHG